jgi:hypothetical protein
MQPRREFRTRIRGHHKRKITFPVAALAAFRCGKGDAFAAALPHSASEDQRHQEQHQEHDEQNFGDPRRRAGNTREAQKSRDKRDHQKDY